MLTTRTTASTVRHCQAVCKPGEKDICYCFNLKQLRVNIVLLFTYQLERQLVRPVRVKCQINIDI